MNVGFVMYHSMKTVATETILFVRSGKKAKKGLKEAKRGHENNGHFIIVEDPIRGEPIPQESQFTIPIFRGIGPLTSTSYWSNFLKRIDSFHGIVVHNS